jgi:hypothetical protein
MGCVLGCASAEAVTNANVVKMDVMRVIVFLLMMIAYIVNGVQLMDKKMGL